MIDANIKRQLLCYEAQRWVGVKEEGGDNKGQLVQMFQRAVDQKDNREPWCLAFLQYCIINVDNMCLKVFTDNKFAGIFKTEHCMTAWKNTPDRYKFQTPIAGYVAIWQHAGTQNGHAGLVVRGLDKDFTFSSVEANTSLGDGIVREGDQVALRSRSIKPVGSMRLLGFISVWQP